MFGPLAHSSEKEARCRCPPVPEKGCKDGILVLGAEHKWVPVTPAIRTNDILTHSFTKSKGNKSKIIEISKM